MNCEQARDLAALAASGDLMPGEREALDAHNAVCGECCAAANAFAELCGQLAAMREESAPGHVYTAVRSRVVAEIGERRRPGWAAAWGAFAAVVACSVVLVVTIHHEALVVNQPVQQPAAAVAVANIPDDAPIMTPPSQPRRARKPVARAAAQESNDPLVVHMFTDDPDVVIYWIADARGNRAQKEIIQ